MKFLRGPKERTKLVISICLIVLFIPMILSVSGCREFRKGRYNSSRYYMEAPYRWRPGEWYVPTIMPVEPDYETRTFTLVSPEKYKGTKEPEASISLISLKLSTASWLDDIWPIIKRETMRSGFKILDSGEIVIGGQISQWMVIQSEELNVVILEFYAISDASIFYKIQYAARPEAFNKHRRSFEAAKTTLKIKESFF